MVYSKKFIIIKKTFHYCVFFEANHENLIFVAFYSIFKQKRKIVKEKIRCFPCLHYCHSESNIIIYTL